MKVVPFRKPYITGIAATVPKEIFSLQELHIDKKTLQGIEELTGIHSVRVSPEHMTAMDYCADAAGRLLAGLDVAAQDVDALIYVTPQPDYLMPGTGFVLQEKLGLPKKCLVTDMNSACSGFLMGLFHAFLYVESGYCQNVLLCVGDTATKHIHHDDRSLRTVMGDGGAAALITSEQCTRGGDSCFSFFSDGGGLKSLYIPAGGNRNPLRPGVTDVEETDAEGNTRRSCDMYMDGMAVMLFAINSVPGVVNKALEIAGWTKAEVDAYVFHQANKFMVQSMGKRLRLPLDKVLLDVDGIGNTGCTSIPIALCHSRESDMMKHREKIVLCGFGAGLSSIAGTFDLSGTVLLPMEEI